MSKRKYTNVQAVISVIERMLEADKSVYRLLKRQRKKAIKGAPEFRQACQDMTGVQVRE